MTRVPIISLSLFLSCSFAVAAQQGAYREEPRIISDRAAYRVDQRLPDLAFTTLTGEASTLSSYADGTPVVIALRDTGCPISKKYAPRLAALEAEYSGQVRFLFVNPSEADSIESMREDARSRGYRGAYVDDRTGTLARALRAQRTTDVFLIDPSLTLRYRGAIDDQYGIGYQHAEPGTQYLRDAIDAVRAQRLVEVPATTAPGCDLPFASAEQPEAAPGADAVTYFDDISRIIQRNCQACHRAGGPAPFALETYEQVKGRRSAIAFAIEAGIMPPWHADAARSLPFANDRSLSERDRAALLSWIDHGAPAGDAAHAPSPLVWTTGWQIGEPDAVVAIPQAFDIPAEGAVSYKYTYVKTDFAEDKWIEAMEIRPTEPEVVHHVLVFLEAPPQEGESRADVRRRWQGGLDGYFAGLVPGQAQTVYPSGNAKRLPKGAWLKFQLHYTPNGTACSDQTEIGFVFADSAPAQEMHTASAQTTRFRIPPGAGNHEVVAHETLAEPVWLYSFAPHMHLRGKAFRYDILHPDGTEETVLDIPRYDFNWQTRYKLHEPMLLPAGTRIRATAWYDNSADNPANPDPTQAVGFGEQTWEEMMIGYFEYYPADAGEK